MADGPHAAAHDAHDAPRELRHHFVDMEAQQEASALGMWIFLVTEVLFFGGMFTAYVIYRASYTRAFEGASNLLDLKLGAFNTAVLILSSLTMALAVRAGQQGKKNLIVLFLTTTILLGSRNSIAPPRHVLGSWTSGRISAGSRGSKAPAGIIDSSPVVVP